MYSSDATGACIAIDWTDGLVNRFYHAMIDCGTNPGPPSLTTSISCSAQRVQLSRRPDHYRSDLARDYPREQRIVTEGDTRICLS
jgi:hypothetical protein